MKKFILSLRKLSLSWVVASVPIIFFVSGLLSEWGYRYNLQYLLIPSITVAIAFFYITFASHAIIDEGRAVKTSWLFITAHFILIPESMVLNLMTPIGLAIRLPFFFYDYIGNVYECVEFMAFYDSETGVFIVALMNLFMLAGLLYSSRSISQRYKSAWWMAIAAQAFSACSVLMVIMTNSITLGGILNIFSSVISLILFFFLLVIGGKEKNEGIEVSNIETPTTSPQVHNDISTKSEELRKLKSLLDAGILTQEEFDCEKKKILNS